MNKKQFYETYCMYCGTQRCGGIDDEEFSSGCLYRWNLDGADAAAEIKRLNDKIMELAGIIMKLRAPGMWRLETNEEEPNPMFKLVVCSNCNLKANHTYPYCPHCGARMDGGNK